jgi:Hsp20/alpha crystallin family
VTGRDERHRASRPKPTSGSGVRRPVIEAGRVRIGRMDPADRDRALSPAGTYRTARQPGAPSAGRGAGAKVTPRGAVRPCPAGCGRYAVGSGYLTIRAERHDKTEGKHRTEFRYGSFSRCLPLPGDANADDVTASYDHGILTVSVGLKAAKKDEVKKIEVKPAK